MDYTEGTEAMKRKRAKKMMLWFGIVSLGMSFAGLTSAYVVSRERNDWLEQLELPSSFTISLFVIILSSLTIEWAKRAIQKGKNGQGMTGLVATWLLGVVFIYLQYLGFAQIYSDFGYAFTGATSNVAYSFIFVIVVVHILHVLAALMSLLVVIYNHYKQSYSEGNTLGVELATTFWHFVDILWIYLFLFFYFVR